MNVEDCNNHVKSAINFFGDSCAVGSLENRYNPLGDNPNQFCELCGSDTPGVRCKNRDPYADNPGALLCLQEKGDIAFVTEKTLFQNNIILDDYELVCPSQGALMRLPITSYKDCSWGVAPGRINRLNAKFVHHLTRNLSFQEMLLSYLPPWIWKKG